MNSVLDWRLIRQVSRSFYLSLRFLPDSIRETLALAYLLARASDTLADSVAAPTEERLKMLRAFAEERWDAALLPEHDKEKLRNEERLLISTIPALFGRLGRHADADLIREVLTTIVSGQIMDIERFSLQQGSELSREELEDYTFRVAGCVGQFWARLCIRKIPRVVRLPEEKMIQLGIHYGKGLQLVNILRDRAEDVKNGREYFSQDAFQDLILQAHAFLDEGRQFASALRGIRLRFCCFLPAALGLLTLRLVQQHPETKRVRVSRLCVYTVMARCFFAACMAR